MKLPGKLGSEGGGAIVEAALALPVLLVVFLGIAEISMLFLARQDVLHAARGAARVLAVEDGTEAEARAKAAGHLGDKATGATITVTEPDPDVADDCDVSVRVAIPSANIKPIQFFGFFGNDDVTAHVTMRKEGCG